MASPQDSPTDIRSLYVVGVVSGLAAGAWLGCAEAPTELVMTGMSPFVISAAMVMGVFVARWTVPTILKGTEYIFADLKTMAHLMVWAVLAGAIWAVANTLTIFAVRDIGLAVAFPIWNSNCLVGLFWGWLLFNELHGADRRQWTKVLGGALAIVAATAILGYASTQDTGGMSGEALHGIIAALGAGLLWGTMYIPYRKAYLSGINPLSFVTIFTFGELSTVLLLSVVFLGGLGNLTDSLIAARPSLFWLFLGGFCWVLGDLFQQFAAKYIGIGRGIPLANTNQLWGLAWAALVFGTLSFAGTETVIVILSGSLLMIAGAASISLANASAEEQANWDAAIERECRLYRLDRTKVQAAVRGEDPLGREKNGHRWWDFAISLLATVVFVVLALYSTRPPIPVNFFWMSVITICALIVLILSGILLYRRTGFS